MSDKKKKIIIGTSIAGILLLIVILIIAISNNKKTEENTGLLENVDLSELINIENVESLSLIQKRRKKKYHQNIQQIGNMK